MPRMSNRALGLALDPPISGQRVGQLRQRGMPGDPAGAAAWRARNLDFRYVKGATMATAQPATSGRYSMADVVQWFEFALERAGAEIVAALHVDTGLALEHGDAAFKCVAEALSAALDEDAPRNQLWQLAGPCDPVRSPDDIAAARKRIARLIEAFKASDE